MILWFYDTAEIIAKPYDVLESQGDGSVAPWKNALGGEPCTAE